MKNLFFLFLFFCVLKVHSQKINRIEIPSAKFSIGDDKKWSSPSFNDKDWTEIKTNFNWEQQGYNNYDGYAWYRMHFYLPLALKNEAFWKDSLRIFLAKIDDADEIFLNGTLLSKNGSYPSDPNGYITRWNEWRELHISVNNPLIHWDQENIIAIRVYDGNGGGGIFAGTPFVNMLDVVDGIKIKAAQDLSKKEKYLLTLNNTFSTTVNGVIKINVIDKEINKSIQTVVKPVKLLPFSEFINAINILPGRRLEIQAEFTEKNTGKTVTLSRVTPYILTPKPSPKPRINNALVFGVRPNAPFLFKIAVTGEKPIQYSVENLPNGLEVDSKNGVIKGVLSENGEYKMQLIAKNKLGVAKKEFIVKCGDLLALTPPMGWNSWNCWGLSVSDEKVKASAQALIDKGLIDHGWTYMNIDDGWEAPQRNANGEIVTNKKFPDMKSLGDWLHNKGLKFGIYSSPGPLTCGGYLGSYQHELQDAVTYTNWGIDYLKYDWCSYGKIHGGKDTTLASYKKPYEVMQKALRSQPRDIIYSLCQYGMKDVWKWGNEVDGNCWRTTGDIEDTWESLSSIGFNQNKIAEFAKPGRWNDPDMLIVGQVGWGENLHPTKLTPDEQYTHISLWCLLSSPLLIGCDISKLDDFTLNLLTNDEVIALNQDPAGNQARQIIKKDDYQVWVKELSDGTRALGIFNLTEKYQTIQLDWKDLQLTGNFKLRDLWRQKNLGAFKTFKTKVAPHGVSLIKLSE